MKLKFKEGQVYQNGERIGFVTDLQINITDSPIDPMEKTASFSVIVTGKAVSNKFVKSMQYSFPQKRKKKKK